MEYGAPDDGHDDGPDAFRYPPPPEDRLWRHPSELHWAGGGAGAGAGEPRRGSRSPGRGQLWGVAMVSGLVGAVLSLGLVAATGGLDRDAPREVLVRETVRPALALTDVARTGSVVRIADEARPAIVRIEVRGRGRSGTGSGVIFRDNGYVLTNAHVVQGRSRITAVLEGGEELRGRLVGADDDTDIAVVKLDDDGPYPTAVLGSAADLRVGEPAIAIGSPLGLSGGASVTTGVVSALGRRIDAEDGAQLLDMIQTDAPIAPGSSGGALLDGSGAVIGITTAVAVNAAGAEGFGFATPIDIARSVADELIATGKVVHVWLGIAGTEVASAETEELGIRGGAKVQEVFEGTPAAGIDIREGDVIVALDSVPIDSMTELVIELRRRHVGDHISVTWRRGDERMTAYVALAERPDTD